MSEKRLLFLLVLHQPYFCEDNPEEECKLFSAISSTYVPLLNTLYSLERENIESKVSLVISPSLCTLLEDSSVQEKYLKWLDSRIAFGESEIERCATDEARLVLAKKCMEKAKKEKEDFQERYSCRLIKHFSELAKNGRIEILATTAGYAFLPHFSDYPESIAAQVEEGISAYKHFFASFPEGFYLPYLGYSSGLERIIRPYGIRYTVLDSRAVLFSKDQCPKGIFAPVKTFNSLVLFANDSRVVDKIAESEDAYVKDSVFLAKNRDVAYELDSRYLCSYIGDGEVRIPSGYVYYSNEAENDALYDEKIALEKAKFYAKEFVQDQKALLEKASSCLDNSDVQILCTIPEELLGDSWVEGSYWFEQVLRFAPQENIKCLAAEDVVESIDRLSLPTIEPYPCSGGKSGYGEELLDSSNAWRMRTLMKSVERMIELANRFNESSGLKCRMLNIGARAVLLAQSADWPMMMHQKKSPDFAKQCFCNFIDIFSKVFESLGSNTVSTEWLTGIEKKYSIFSWLNYKIFSKKL